MAHLHGEGAKDDGAEDGVPEDALKDVALAVDFPGVDLVEELHHDEGVEDDGVVFGRRRVQRSVAAAVDVKDLLTWWRRKSQCYIPRGHDSLDCVNLPVRPTKCQWTS